MDQEITCIWKINQIAQGRHWYDASQNFLWCSCLGLTTSFDKNDLFSFYVFSYLLGATVDCMYSTFGLLRDSSNLPRLGPYGMFTVQLGEIVWHASWLDVKGYDHYLHRFGVVLLPHQIRDHPSLEFFLIIW